MITLQIHQNSKYLELQSKLVKEIKAIDITSFNKVPDSIPEGKKVVTHQPPFFERSRLINGDS